jgi:hypothetical protein
VSPEERIQKARMMAHALHAQRDARETTAKARKVFLDRFEREVDPDGVLSPQERAKRAKHARKAYMTRLALKSAQSRRTNAEAPPRSHESDATTSGRRRARANPHVDHES